MDSAKHHSSVQETSSQATPLQTDVRMTQSLSLGSNKSNNSSSRSTSSSHGRQRYLSSLSNNPTMARSPASGSSMRQKSCRRKQISRSIVVPEMSNMVSIVREVGRGNGRYCATFSWPPWRFPVEELLHESDHVFYLTEFTDMALPIDQDLLARIIQTVVTGYWKRRSFYRALQIGVYRRSS
ncbi:uncharacterized protein FRV6_00923 [Fusarium oxysporum]|uniref:Uncharacterized protein n=1 Tax=Fusarium oxysporum TaxID=5507 RepID=A0A2H3SKM1_FUSOX|nr:uncharacterized protein FRV6_00923 [Fusarium oxysporum]